MTIHDRSMSDRPKSYATALRLSRDERENKALGSLRTSYALSRSSRCGTTGDVPLLD